MKLNWKQTAGAFALSVAMIGMSVVGPAGAAAKRPPRVHPPVIVLPMPTKTETPEAPKPGEGTPEAERGIKDPGVKSCGSCGVTGREAAPGTGGPGGGPRVEAQGSADKLSISPTTPATDGPGGGPHAAAKKKGRFPRNIHIVMILSVLAAGGGVALSNGGNAASP